MRVHLKHYSQLVVYSTILASGWVVKFGQHLPSPFFMQWGSLEVLKGRERTWGTGPQIVPDSAHSAPPRGTARLRPLKSTWRTGHSPRSQQPPESREEREGREGKARVRGGPERGPWGAGEVAWIGIGGQGGAGETPSPDLWVGLKTRTGLRINDGCAYWRDNQRVQDRTPCPSRLPPRSSMWEVPCSLHPLPRRGWRVLQRPVTTLSCYRQDTGKLRPGGWGHAANQAGKCQLPQSSYKGELPSLHHAEHKVLRLGHYFVRQMAVTCRAWERNTVSPVHPLDGVLLLSVYPKLCWLIYSVGQTEIVLFVNFSIALLFRNHFCYISLECLSKFKMRMPLIKQLCC